jgi:IS5 family transposase
MGGVKSKLALTLEKANRIVEQSRQKKRVGDTPKLYSFHAPEVECISKGKSRKPYEFGVKVGIATTWSGNLIVGTRAFAGNPYDGHTLREQVEQATILMQETGVTYTPPQQAWLMDVETFIGLARQRQDS